jgi:hypothetical protein
MIFGIVSALNSTYEGVTPPYDGIVDGTGPGGPLGAVISPAGLNEFCTSAAGTSIDAFNIAPYGGVAPYSIALSSDTARFTPSPASHTGVTTSANSYINYTIVTYERTGNITITVTDAASATYTYIASVTFTRSDVLPP